MEYWTSAASMLAEEFWQIAEGFVEVQNVEIIIYKVETAICGKFAKENFHNVESMPKKLPQCGKCVDFHNVDELVCDTLTKIGNLRAKSTRLKIIQFYVYSQRRYP